MVAIACIALVTPPIATQAGPATTPRPAPNPARKSAGWQFRVEPYGWLMGLDGTTGAGGFTTSVNASSRDVLQNLNWGIFLQAEARNGRWGILADGFFAELGSEGDTPGPLYSDLDATLQQGLGEIALACRVWEGRAGFVDLLAGARYNSLGLDLDASLDDDGIRGLSEAASARVVDQATTKARQILAPRVAAAEQRLAATQAAIQTRVADEITARLTDLLRDAVAGVPGSKAKLVAGTVVARVGKEKAALAEAIAAQRIAAARSSARARVDAAVDKAERRLAKAIQRELTERLPDDASASKQWVDPFVGIRAQWNITGRLYLAARGDIGGFGVGSDLVWQAMGTLGYNFNDHLFLEAGYRHLQTDYADGGFLFDVAQGGAFVGFGLRF